MANFKTNKKLLKIGQLSKLVGVLPSTINFYTKEGLLQEAARSQGGYRMYEESYAVQMIKKISKLQEVRRLTIEEIKDLNKKGRL